MDWKVYHAAGHLKKVTKIMKGIKTLSGLQKHYRNSLLVMIALLNTGLGSAQQLKQDSSSMYFISAGVFFSPSESDKYFGPALDVEAGFWKMNRKNFFSWGASMQLWRFTNVSYEPNGPSIRNNTDGFINLNGMFFYNNKIITPYVGLNAAVATDFKNVGAAGGISVGLNHKTNERLETFIQGKYVRFTNRLDYLDMRFLMIGFTLRLMD